MLDFTEESGVLNQTMDASLFFLQLVWLQEISKYFTTKNFFSLVRLGTKEKLLWKFYVFL
jgi:hypothetical protein